MKTIAGNRLYHVNQTSFGLIKVETTDELYNLLMSSQIAESTESA